MPLPTFALKRQRSDVLLIILYSFLVGEGLLMIYSVGTPEEGYGGWAGMIATPVGKQVLWLGLSLISWFVINYVLDRGLWLVSAYPIYIGTLVLLMLVLLIGKEINGARSWFGLAGFTFQPSELAKFGCCLAMAAYLSQWSGKLDRWRAVAGGLALWLLPAVLILAQPDAGSALVFFSFMLVMYREGLTPVVYALVTFVGLCFVLGILFPPGLLVSVLLALLVVVFGFTVRRRKRWWGPGALAAGAGAVYGYWLGFGWPVIVVLGGLFALGSIIHLLQRNTRLVAAAAVTLLLGTGLMFAANYTFNNVLRPHHQARIDVWLRPGEVSTRGAGYNVLQSKLAISAGGFDGRGIQQGTMTRFGYVPEQLTDFVFTAVGEEQGFMGTGVVILLFLAMLYRITILAERQKRTFARAYAYGFAGILLVHLLVNIGMTLGLMPIIGIPLPFMSKGGSSLLSFTIMLAVLLKLDKHRATV